MLRLPSLIRVSRDGVAGKNHSARSSDGHRAVVRRPSQGLTAIPFFAKRGSGGGSPQVPESCRSLGGPPSGFGGTESPRGLCPPATFFLVVQWSSDGRSGIKFEILNLTTPHYLNTPLVTAMFWECRYIPRRRGRTSCGDNVFSCEQPRGLPINSTTK